MCWSQAISGNSHYSSVLWLSAHEVDFVGGVLELLGFDPETACWAGKQEISSGQYQYVWVPERNFSQFMLS